MVKDIEFFMDVMDLYLVISLKPGKSRFLDTSFNVHKRYDSAKFIQLTIRQSMFFVFFFPYQIFAYR